MSQIYVEMFVVFQVFLFDLFSFYNLFQKPVFQVKLSK